MKTIVKSIIKRNKYKILLLQLASMVNTIAMIGNIFLEGQLLNSLVYSKDRGNFFKILCLLIFLGILKLILSFFTNKVQILDYRRAFLYANELLIKKLYKKDTLEILKKDPIKLTDQINDDITEVMSFIFQTISQLIALLLSLAIILVYLIKTNVLYFWIILLLLFIYTMFYFFLKPRMYTVSLDLKNIYNEYFSKLSDWLRRYVEIKGKEEIALNRFSLRKTENKLLKIGHKDFVLNYVMSLLQIGIQLIFQLFLFIWGGMSVIAGKITIGYFSVILQYFNQLLSEADNLFSILVRIESFKASYARMDNLLSMKPEVDGAIKINTVQNIFLNKVNISLNGEKELFKNTVTYRFENPGFYVITGKNGIGKSTLLRSITGIYNSKISGDIFINGMEVEKINRKEMRRYNIGFLFQDIDIPSCTVEDYLEKYVDKIENKYYSQVFYSKRFNIKHFLDKKMDTLSSGELQLVRLYSALTKNAECLVLDESMANIHSSMKKDILQLLEEISKKCMIIMISHDEEILFNKNTLKIE